MLAKMLRAGVLAGCCTLLGAGCGEDAPQLMLERGSLSGVGSARLDLPLGSLRAGTATLVLSGQPEFEAQTRQLRVTGPDAERSVFFGSLPTGIRYRLELLAGDCRGQVEFGVEANRTTQLELQVSCASAEPAPTSTSTLPAPSEPVEPAPPEPPDCALIEQVVAEPALQRGTAPTSTVQVVPVAGVSLSSVEWSLMEAAMGLGTLFPAPSNGLAVGFDCTRDGVAGIVARVSGTRDGRACRQQGQAQVTCLEQGGAGPSSPVPPVVPPVLPGGSGACGTCSGDFCAAQLAAVAAQPEAATVLSCVLGPSWSAGERASSESCGNLDLIGCYCGSTPELVCEQADPATLDGPCREPILSGSGCTDSSCVKASLLDPAHPAGVALSYLRCQQDFCYDLCFNL